MTAPFAAGEAAGFNGDLSTANRDVACMHVPVFRMSVPASNWGATADLRGPAYFPDTEALDQIGVPVRVLRSVIEELRRWPTSLK